MGNPTPPPPPPENPGYDALRLGADWASAVRGNTVFFDYTSGSIGTTEPVNTDSVMVATAPSATGRSGIQSAVLTLGNSTVTVPAATCSAIFWSESAVEKFLLPYYASAAGFHAQEVMNAISSAWYGYDDSMPACALTFQYPAQGLYGALSLWNTVGVVYAVADPVTGELVLQQPVPLLQFLERSPRSGLTSFPPVAPPQWNPVPTSAALTPVESVGAREAAEYVSGLRGQEVKVYQQDNVLGGLVSVLPGEPPPPDSTLLFDAMAVLMRLGRPTITVALNVDGLADNPYPLTGIGGSAANVPDSVFWTDGSVDMLMLPYYASVKGHLAPWYLIVLLGKWAGVIPSSLVDAADIAAHIPAAVARLLLRHVEVDSSIGGIVDRLLGTEPPVALTTSEVFAIVHLPRSEYVDEPFTPADPPLPAAAWPQPIYLENRTWLLTATRAAPLVAPGRRLVG